MTQVETPSKSILLAADLIERAAREGRLRPVDLAVLADALRRAGTRVDLPPPPHLLGKKGWYTSREVRCNKPTCRACRPGGPGHGRYALYRWKEGGRRHEECLGSFRRRGGPRKPTKGPSRAAAPAPAGDALPFDPRVLHDD